MQWPTIKSTLSFLLCCVFNWLKCFIHPRLSKDLICRRSRDNKEQDNGKTYHRLKYLGRLQYWIMWLVVVRYYKTKWLKSGKLTLQNTLFLKQNNHLCYMELFSYITEILSAKIFKNNHRNSINYFVWFFMRNG
jgi:hypothetical protein